jgi:hypothetical protein
VERETRALFDVEKAPLMRIGAYLVADDTWWLCLTHCHAVLEGWSHHSLLAELIGAYTRLRDGVALEPHRPQAVRYADFIAAEHEAVQAGDDVEFWRRRVADVAKFTLPQHWAVPVGRPKRFQVRVPFADLASGLRSAVYASQTSMKAVLHAAHLKVMSMLTHEPRFHTGLVVDARPEASGAERVYGMYLNSVPFVFERTAATWSELARQVYDQETELWPHRRLPLPALQRAVGDSDLIDVLFNYLDFHEFEAEYETIAPDAQAAVIGAGSNDWWRSPRIRTATRPRPSCRTGSRTGSCGPGTATRSRVRRNRCSPRSSAERRVSRTPAQSSPANTGSPSRSWTHGRRRWRPGCAPRVSAPRPPWACCWIGAPS